MGSIREQVSNGSVSYNLEERNGNGSIQVPVGSINVQRGLSGDRLANIKDASTAGNKYRLLEIVVLCTVMLTIGELLTLPIIFYYLPVNSVTRLDVSV